MKFIIAIAFFTVLVELSQQACSPFPPSIRYGLVGPGGSETGDRRNITCYSGYRIAGSNYIECLQGGVWSSGARCVMEPTPAPLMGYNNFVQVRCDNDKIPSISNGYVGSGDTKVGSGRYIFCDEGYRNEGSIEIYCQWNAEWTRGGTCVPDQSTTAEPTVDCSKAQLPGVSGGFLEPSSAVAVGSQRFIRCIYRYRIVGNPTITCLSDGRWSQPGVCRPGKKEGEQKG